MYEHTAAMKIVIHKNKILVWLHSLQNFVRKVVTNSWRCVFHLCKVFSYPALVIKRLWNIILSRIQVMNPLFKSHGALRIQKRYNYLVVSNPTSLFRYIADCQKQGHCLTIFCCWQLLANSGLFNYGALFLYRTS